MALFPRNAPLFRLITALPALIAGLPGILLSAGKFATGVTGDYREADSDGLPACGGGRQYIAHKLADARRSRPLSPARA